MLRKPPILEEGARTAALVWRLARDFMRPHAARIALAFLLMGAAAGSTALRAWLMQPVLDRVFVGRDASWLLLIAGGGARYRARQGHRRLRRGGADEPRRPARHRRCADRAVRPADACRSRLFPRPSERHPDLAVHQRRRAAAQRRGECSRSNRQGRADRGLPGRRHVLPGLAVGAGLVLHLSGGDPSDRRHRPAHAPGHRQHPGRDRPADDVAEPDLSGRAPGQGLRHGGL